MITAAHGHMALKEWISPFFWSSKHTYFRLRSNTFERSLALNAKMRSDHQKDFIRSNNTTITARRHQTVPSGSLYSKTALNWLFKSQTVSQLKTNETLRRAIKRYRSIERSWQSNAGDRTCRVRTLVSSGSRNWERLRQISWVRRWHAFVFSLF